MIERKGKFAPNAINVYRVIAALCVFVLHSVIFDDYNNHTLMPRYLFFLYPSAWGGVFMFMVLGGYLAGKGFASGRYEMSVKGVLTYYKKRAFRILIPTWAYLLLVFVFIYPTVFTVDWKQLLPLIFFYFNGYNSLDGVGNLWYIYTAVHLYLLSPFLHLLLVQCKRLGKWFMWGLLGFVVLAGLGFRLGMEQYVLTLDSSKHHYVWYNFIYTPFWGNLDLWISGMILNYIDRSKNRRPLWVRILSVALLVAVLLVSAWYSYLNHAGFSWYRSPTCYLIACVFYLETFDREGGAKGNTIVDKFASITFEVYLFHSIIFSRIRIMLLPLALPSWAAHCIMLGLGFVLTVLFSIAFKVLFSGKQKQIKPLKG